MTIAATDKKGKTSTAKKAVQGKQTAKEKPTKGPVSITPDKRAQMIAEAAYYRAEFRGFDPQGQEQDWLDAESEVGAIVGRLQQNRADVAH